MKTLKILILVWVFHISSVLYANELFDTCMQPTIEQQKTILAMAKRSHITQHKDKAIFCEAFANRFYNKETAGIILSDNKLTDLSPLQYMKEIDYLNLSNNNISDLSPLSKVKTIEHLDLSGNPITDITPLAKFSGITILSLSYTKLNDNKVLENYPNLTFLSLTSQDDDFSFLSKLKKLKFLNIRDSNVHNICDLNPENIISLAISGTKVKDINCLRALPQLSRVDLNNSPIHDLSVLKYSKKLERIEINNTNVESIKPLIGLTKLHVIYLKNTKITDLSGLYNPMMSIVDARGVNLRWCSPKNVQDIVDGVSCYEKDGTEKSWWKRLFRM